MRINKVVAKMQAGERAYGCNLNFPSTFVAACALDEAAHRV